MSDRREEVSIEAFYTVVQQAVRVQSACKRGLHDQIPMNPTFGYKCNGCQSTSMAGIERLFSVIVLKEPQSDRLEPKPPHWPSQLYPGHFNMYHRPT